MTNSALAHKTLALADDSFLLGHRNSEWSGHAPILEEDIAFSNIALDELGHAQLWYELYRELTGAEPDRVVFFRDPRDWRNVQWVELPRGDWAFSMLRQYLFDTYENVVLGHLRSSTETRVAEIAEKILAEEVYHLRHTSNWVKRLGLGTEESRKRMQQALDAQWGYALQLFVPLEDEGEVITANIMPDPAALQKEWDDLTAQHLADSGLVVPETRSALVSSRAEHSEHLTDLLADMQQVARTEEFGIEW